MSTIVILLYLRALQVLSSLGYMPAPVSPPSSFPISYMLFIGSGNLYVCLLSSPEEISISFQV